MLQNTLRKKVKKYYTEENNKLNETIRDIIREMDHIPHICCKCDEECSCETDSIIDDNHPYCEKCSPANDYYKDKIHSWLTRLIDSYKKHF